MGGSWRVRLVGLVAAAAVLAGVVSVGPAGAQSGEGYADVVGTTHEEDITALDALGVFDRTGCDEGFCPGAPLKRWTMAVWMVRVLDGEEPPAVTSTRFSDVDAQQWWAAHVERFAELGVTRGYGDDTFRPDQSVTRAQMAAFLTRAFDLPNADDAGFSDIEGNTHYDAINAFAASGITHGYGDGTFRPGVATTRGQMAAFFTRSASLLVAQGRYAAVSAGGEHTCARRADSTIECWGNNGSGQTDAPEGQFSAVSAGGEHTCARRADSTIECWGNNESGQTDAPEGQFSAVSAGSWHTCGLRADSTIECWGNNEFGQADPPEGQFSAVSAGSWHTCGLRADGTIECRGDTEWGQADPPEGQFSAVSAGSWHTCGLRATSAIVCWGADWNDLSDAPEGRFLSVTSGMAHSCGLRADSTIACWGNNESGQTDAPEGQFSAVSASFLNSCALDTSCSFGEHTCALRADSIVVCWGSNGSGQTDVPGVTLEVSGVMPLRSIGQTMQLAVTANFLDGTNKVVESAQMEWESSDTDVATAADGVVTAIGGGNATIVATYDDWTVEIPVSVRISTGETATVRIIYAVPSDREFLPEFSEFIENSVTDVQSWYRQQLDGLTFSFYDVVPQQCQLQEDNEFYSIHAWERVLEGVQPCAPAAHGTEHVWIVFVDVDPACAPDGTYGNYEDGYNQLYRGGDGLVIVNYSSQDPGFHNMVAGEDWETRGCVEGPFDATVTVHSSGASTGGIAHELGHAFGRPHPPGCDEGMDSCDDDALMGAGNWTYPDTYLRIDDKEALLRSPFIGSRSGSGRFPTAMPGASAVRGSVTTVNGATAGGALVSLVGDDFWTWTVVDGDGTFEIGVPDGSAGTAMIAVHASESAPCRWLGYYDESGGLTALPERARPVGAGAVADVVLPRPLGEMCDNGPRTISGTVVGPDGRPVGDLWLAGSIHGEFVYAGADGTFEIPLPAGTVGETALLLEASQCGFLGFYATGELTFDDT